MPSMPARMITSPSHSARRNCLRGFAQPCAACLSLPAIETYKSSSWKAAEVDLSSRQVTALGRTSRLTAKEFDLLSYLMARPNKTISHRALLQAVWGPDYGDELEYLRVFVNRLRKKIEPDPSKPQFLVTDAWAGYRFQLPQ